MKMIATHMYSECANPQSCDQHRGEPAPMIPLDARPHVIAYLRWMANDAGAHGGTACRQDRNWLIEEADSLEQPPPELRYIMSNMGGNAALVHIADPDYTHNRPLCKTTGTGHRGYYFTHHKGPRDRVCKTCTRYAINLGWIAR